MNNTLNIATQPIKTCLTNAQDAHTESNVGWLEPLLDEIQKNPQTVIQPHIDEIDPKTIEYQRTGSHVPRGGFSWDLR